MTTPSNHWRHRDRECSRCRISIGFFVSHLCGIQMRKFDSIKSQMGREKEKNQTIVLLLGSREWHAALPHCNICSTDIATGHALSVRAIEKAELKFTDFCSWIERTYENELLVLLWLLPLLVRLYCFSLNSSGNEMFNDDLNVRSNATIYFTHTTDWLTEVAQGIRKQNKHQFPMLTTQHKPLHIRLKWQFYFSIRISAQQNFTWELHLRLDDCVNSIYFVTSNCGQWSLWGLLNHEISEKCPRVNRLKRKNFIHKSSISKFFFGRRRVFWEFPGDADLCLLFIYERMGNDDERKLNQKSPLCTATIEKRDKWVVRDFFRFRHVHYSIQPCVDWNRSTYLFFKSLSQFVHRKSMKANEAFTNGIYHQFIIISSSLDQLEIHNVRARRYSFPKIEINSKRDSAPCPTAGPSIHPLNRRFTNARSSENHFVNRKWCGKCVRRDRTITIDI